MKRAAAKSPLTRGELTAEEFELVSVECRRWSELSLHVARALLVDDMKLSQVAQKFDITPQHANTIRTRFRDRASQVRVKKVSAESFMAEKRPDATLALRPFKRDLVQLRRANYSTEQMLEFLERNQIKTDVATVEKFLGEFR